MQRDRERVVDALRSRGEHDKAIQAECLLPRYIDTERDAAVLHQFRVADEVEDDD